MLRKVLMMGLKKTTKSKEAYWSKCKRRLPARSMASSCRRSSKGQRILKYFNPCKPLAWIGDWRLAAIGCLRSLAAKPAGFQPPVGNTADSVPTRQKCGEGCQRGRNT